MKSDQEPKAVGGAKGSREPKRVEHGCILKASQISPFCLILVPSVYDCEHT